MLHTSIPVAVTTSNIPDANCPATRCTIYAVVAGDEPTSTPPPPTVLRLTAVADKGSTDRCDGEDWIALANTGTIEIALVGYVLHDDKGPDDTKAFTFAAGATIAAGATTTLCKDAEGSFKFGIGGDDTVTLLDAGSVVVDTSGELGDRGALNYVWTRGSPAGDWGYVELGTLEPTPSPTLLAPTMAPNEHGIFHHIDVYLSATIWDLHDSCTFDQSKSRPEFGSGRRLAKCDYQPATCSHNGMQPRPCLVRRKGSGSWSRMDDKPSLKIKNFNDDTKHEFARYPCATTSSCNSLPSGSLASAVANVWKTTKLTLNNQVQGDGEIDGYKLYRDAGLIAPLAEQATVRLYRRGQLMVGPASYAMIETVNDDAFVEKHFGADHALFEVESLWFVRRHYKIVAFKRDSGVLAGALQHFASTDSDSTRRLTEMSETSYNMSYFHRYLAAELLTGNNDAACARNSNYFVAATPRENQGPLFTWIPHGIDWSFRCTTGDPRAGTEWGVDWPIEGGYCPVASCFERPECRAEYCAVFEELIAMPHRQRDPPCAAVRAEGLFQDGTPGGCVAPGPTSAITALAVINTMSGCSAADGQSYIQTAADCDKAAAAIFGGRPSARVISKGSKLPGCYWRPKQNDVVFNAAGDPEAAVLGRTSKHSICLGEGVL